MTLCMFVLALLAFAGGVCAIVNLPRSKASVWVFLLGWLPSEHPWHFIAVQALLVWLFDDAVAANALTLPLFVLAWLCLAIAWGRSMRAPVEVTHALQRDLPAAAARLNGTIRPRDLLRPVRSVPDDVVVARDLPYGPVLDGDKGGRNLLDVYQPRGTRPCADGERGAPVLVQVHGGAWVVGHKQQQAMPLVHHMASRGWVVFSINYRLSPQATWPAQVVDVKRALAWVREHAREYGGDPDFIAITGGSAGGHLAALAALTPNAPEFQPGFEDADTRVQAAVPFYGAVDLLNDTGGPGAGLAEFMAEKVFKVPFPLSPEDTEAFAAASPLRRVHADAPPMFLLQGTHDSLVPVETQRGFVEALRGASKAPVVYAEFCGAEHAFDITWSLRTLACRDAIAAFLDEVLERARTGAAVGAGAQAAAPKRRRSTRKAEAAVAAATAAADDAPAKAAPKRKRKTTAKAKAADGDAQAPAAKAPKAKAAPKKKAAPRKKAAPKAKAKARTKADATPPAGDDQA